MRGGLVNPYSNTKAPPRGGSERGGCTPYSWAGVKYGPIKSLEKPGTNVVDATVT